MKGKGNRLKWTGLVEENPIEVEFFSSFGGEGLHAKDFSGVVTAGVEIEA